MKNCAPILLLVILAAPIGAEAASTSCPKHFVAGAAPDLVNQKLALKTREVCFKAFAVLHSGITRTPLWAAEHVTRASLKAAVDTPRKGNFHEEPKLPTDERALMDDYRKSGFDRGHMVPAANAPDDRSQQETFSLANIVPQNGPLNRGLWAGIEEATRDVARKRGELYVVTGVMFQGDRLQRLKGRVIVPTQLFKAVYDPKRNEAAAYVTANTDTDRWEVMSMAQLQATSGIDPFPSLSADVKQTAMKLPGPKLVGKRRDRYEGQTLEDEGGIVSALKRLLR